MGKGSIAGYNSAGRGHIEGRRVVDFCQSDRRRRSGRSEARCFVVES